MSMCAHILCGSDGRAGLLFGMPFSYRTQFAVLQYTVEGQKVWRFWFCNAIFALLPSHFLYSPNFKLLVCLPNLNAN